MNKPKKPRKRKQQHAPVLQPPPTSTRPRFSIIDVSRFHGIEASRGTNVTVGRAVSKLYREKYHQSPEHELREKTFSYGVHCFCTYPGWFWEEVEQIWFGYAKPAEPDPNSLFPRWPRRKR